MIVRASAMVSAIGALFIFASSAQATGLANMTFEQQVVASDFVVVATSVRSGGGDARRIDDTGQLELTRMKVLNVLKGRENIAELYLVTKGEIAELDPGCCKSGRTYILLLKQGRRNIFEAVNGHHSVIMVH